MQYHNIYYRMPAKSVIRGLQKAKEADEISKTAARRKEAIGHYKLFGLASTLNAYKISKATLYIWQRRYKELCIAGLNESSRCRHKKRESGVPNEIRQYISKERQGRGIGKEYIKPWLDEFCEGNGFKKISVSTIGRIIKQLKAKGEILSRKELSFNAKSGKIGELKKTNLYKERRKDRPSKKPGDIVQIDSVHLSENGIKRYFITAIDICGRQTFAKEYKTLNSANAKDFFVDLEKQYPFNIRRVQTDNGLEFYKHFDQYLKRLGITHFWNYPRTPKSNSYIERFNRTFREHFLNTYQGDLTDVQNVQKI